MAHSYDKTVACPDCGDMDGCRIPRKVKRHKPLHRISAYAKDERGMAAQKFTLAYNPAVATAAAEAMYGQQYPLFVCLCGSTRFPEAFQKANLEQTLQGNIVLSIGACVRDDSLGLSEAAKAMLDELHKRKIDHADVVLVLNVGGYIGKSTAGEIAYAKALGKKIMYLETPPCPPPTE